MDTLFTVAPEILIEETFPIYCSYWFATKQRRNNLSGPVFWIQKHVNRFKAPNTAEKIE